MLSLFVWLPCDVDLVKTRGSAAQSHTTQGGTVGAAICTQVELMTTMPTSSAAIPVSTRPVGTDAKAFAAAIGNGAEPDIGGLQHMDILLPVAGVPAHCAMRFGMATDDVAHAESTERRCAALMEAVQPEPLTAKMAAVL
jgi:hypothetical protein